MIKIKASYIIAGAVIVTAAALPLVSLACSTGARSDGRAAIHAAFKTAPNNSKHVIRGTVATIVGTNLTVTGPKGATYAVDASTAKFLMIGTAGLSVANIKVGDKVTIMGTLVGTAVTADNISDQSLLGRDVFMGIVTAKNGLLLTIDTLANKVKTTYTVDAKSAALTRPDGVNAPTTITIDDIAVGDRITAVGTLTGTTVAATAVSDNQPKKMAVAPANVHSGTVTATDGKIITIDSRFGLTKTTYTVDASGALVTKNSGKGAGATTITAADIKVGDRLMVSGTLTGTSIAATTIRDLGLKMMAPKHRPGAFKGPGKR